MQVRLFPKEMLTLFKTPPILTRQTLIKKKNFVCFSSCNIFPSWKTLKSEVGLKKCTVDLRFSESWRPWWGWKVVAQQPPPHLHRPLQHQQQWQCHNRHPCRPRRPRILWATIWPHISPNFLKRIHKINRHKGKMFYTGLLHVFLQCLRNFKVILR